MNMDLAMAVDNLVKEGLVEYYEVVSHFQQDNITQADDFIRNEQVQNALTIVLRDFMVDDEFKQWLKDRM